MSIGESMKRYMIVMNTLESCYFFMRLNNFNPSECIIILFCKNMRDKMRGYYDQVMNGEIKLFGISKENFAKIYFGNSKAFKEKHEEEKRNHLRLAKDGEATCLDCQWGLDLLGGYPASCLHTHKKNISELTRCKKWTKRKLQ